MSLPVLENILFSDDDMVEEVNVPEGKKGSQNKPQQFKRGVTALETASANFSRSDSPFMLFYFHNEKVEIKSDNVSSEYIQADQNLVNKIEGILRKVRRSGQPLSVWDRSNAVALSLALGMTDGSLGGCHLPKLQYKLSTEQKFYTNPVTRRALTAALKTEGFGAGQKKTYGEATHKPAWWSAELEIKLNLTWANFKGVNTPNYPHNWTEAMFNIFDGIYKHYLGADAENYIQSREEVRWGPTAKQPLNMSLLAPKSAFYRPGWGIRPSKL